MEINKSQAPPTANLEVVEASAMEAIANAEINQSIATARRFPRNLHTVKQKMMTFATLDEETAELNAAINLANGEIALIQEFRTRMIADVVTGKFDVRALAASMPETTSYAMIDDLSEDEDLDDLPVDTDTEEAAA